MARSVHTSCGEKRQHRSNLMAAINGSQMMPAAVGASAIGVHDEAV